MVYIFAYVLVSYNLLYIPKADADRPPIIRMKRDERMKTDTALEQHLLKDFYEMKLYNEAIGDDLDLEFRFK